MRYLVGLAIGAKLYNLGYTPSDMKRQVLANTPRNQVNHVMVWARLGYTRQKEFDESCCVLQTDRA